MSPSKEPAERPKKPAPSQLVRRCTQSHIRIGWWSLLTFVTLGLGLEAMHGLKIGWYLDVDYRRLLWTLAHAHGTLLALVHIAFGLTAWKLPGWHPRLRGIASRCLTAAGILIPAGFFLGGIFVYSGDPGLGILLLPAGAILLIGAILLTAIAAQNLSISDSP